MTERVEVVADVDFLQMQTVARARHWFESQAAEFRGAQTLIVKTRGDIDDIRRQKDALEDTTDQAIYLKAIDALKKTRTSRKLTRVAYGTDIYRQYARNEAIALLGQRAANSIIQADRREEACLGDE